MGRRFTYNDLNKLAQRGMKINVPPLPANRIILPKEDCKQVQWMHWNLQYWCNEKALELIKEFKFHDKRFWRFDFAIPALKIGIEYEGINSDISRHTSFTGFTGDTEKYNEAARLGWKVQRYTAGNYKNVLQDLEKIILDTSS